MTSRRHARRVEATWSQAAGGARLASPLVGVFRPAIAVGAQVGPGAALGLLEVLGQDVEVIAPAATRGVVTGVTGAGRAREPVEHGATLYAIDPDAAAVAGTAAVTGATGDAATDGVVFAAPTSGRYYGRPGPGKPAFIAVGDVIDQGHTICMLEVMKTFNRVSYDGARARVTAILVADESDVDAGTPLVRLEPA